MEEQGSISFPPIDRPDGRHLFAAWASYALVVSMVAYLGTGTWLSLRTDTFNFTPLGRWLLFPLSIYHWPWMALVWGALLGVTMAVPLAIGQRWRMRYGLLFAAAAILFGHLPVGALVLILLMWVLGPNRLALLGDWVRPTLTMLVLLAYLAGSCWTARAAVPPGGRGAWLLTPMMIAMAVALIVLSISSAISMVSGRRFWMFLLGVMGLCGGGAWLLFAFSAGDEALDFVVFDHTFGRRSDHFHQEDPAALAEIMDEAAGAEREVKWMTLALAVDASVLPGFRDRVVRGCIEFLSEHPNSPQRDVVAFVQARALDMRLDLVAWKQQQKLRFYDDVVEPHGRSLPLWEALADRGEAPIAVLACYRLAGYHAGRGEFAAALAQLDRIAALPAVTEPPGPLLTVEGLLAAEQGAGPTRWDFDVYQTALDSRRLAWTLEHNRGLDEQADAALRRFLALDSHSPSYQADAAALLAAHPRAPIADNIRVILAYRAAELAKLTALAEADLAGDGDLWARYYLALLQVRAALAADPADWAPALAALQRLTGTEPDGPLDPWTLQARRFQLAIDIRQRFSQTNQR